MHLQYYTRNKMQKVEPISINYETASLASNLLALLDSCESLVVSKIVAVDHQYQQPVAFVETFH